MSARKVMLLGEIGVGKSSLARRLVSGKFDTAYIPTIGVDVYSYAVPPEVTGQPMSLIVWDTDGNLGEAIFSHVYSRQASAALIVGDVTRRATLDAMVRLGAGFRSAFPGRILLNIVNKTDLLHPAEEPELPAALTQPGAELVMTSALTGARVLDAFYQVAQTIVRRGQ